MIKHVLKHTKRLIVLVIGGTILILGIILIFAPGPAIIIIPLGLAILATEFLWAKRLLNKVKNNVKKVKNKVKFT